MATTYIPISCSYYDRLEAWAVRQESVKIQFRDLTEKKILEAEGIIVDLLSRDQVEYLVLESGDTIRLDHLITVNGVPLPDNSTCGV